MIKFKNVYLFIYIFLCSSMFIIFFSRSTSPLFATFWGADSAYFRYIGRSINNGMILYGDLVDNKGPIIHLINSIGELISPSIGILFLQMINLSIFIAVQINIFRINNKTTIHCLLYVFILYSFLSRFLEGGNLTEEYCLPLLSLSFYYQLIYWKNHLQHKSHPPAYSLIYGITFAFCFLTRLTNSIGLVVAVFIIFMGLLVRKNLKNLFYNVFFFILGFFILIFPFIIYFYSHGLLYDFFYYSFIYNVTYAANSISPAYSYIFSSLSIFKVYFFPFLILLGYFFKGFYFLSLKKYYLSLFLIAFSSISLLFFSFQKPYLHYYVIFLPYLATLFYDIFSFQRKYINKLIFLFVFVFSVFCIYNPTRLSMNTLNREIPNNDLLPLQEIISQHDSVLIWNVRPDLLVRIDNYKNPIKFFSNQEALLNHNNSIHNELLYLVNNSYFDYIIIQNDRDYKTIYQLLDKSYTLDKTIDDNIMKRKYYAYKNILN